MRRQSLRERPEWQFFAALPAADAPLAAAWWLVLVLRGILPTALAVAMGALVAAVERRAPLARPLAFVGVAFVALQVLAPLHQAIGANLGSRDCGVALRPAHRRLHPAARAWATSRTRRSPPT